MEFEWGENKNQSNIKKHNIGFLDAAEMLISGDYLVKPSAYTDETRYIAIGILDKRYIAVVYTLRDERLRIISARAARKLEKRDYEEKRKNN